MTESEKVGVSSTPVPVREPAWKLIEDVLCDWGVFAGLRDQRHERAVALANLELTADEVRLVAQHVQESLPADTAPGRLAMLVAWNLEPGRCRLLLEDLRRFHAAIGRRTRKPVEHYPNAPRGAQYCDCDGCLAERAKAPR